MSEALAALVMLAMLGSVTHLSIEAVVANEERNEAVAAAMRAEEVANEMEWVAIQAVERRDTVCSCLFDLQEDPMANHLRHAAALSCKRCRILTVNGPSNE